MKTLKERVQDLRLHGLIADWEQVADASWLPGMIEREEQERHARSLDRRSAMARIPAFKPLSDFDWNWPSDIDRPAYNRLLEPAFVAEAGNAVLTGPQGTGKTTLAANAAHQAIINGYTVRFEKAPDLLTTLAHVDRISELERRLTLLARPRLLVLDRIGYQTHDTHQANILFQIISRRYRKRSTIITTSRPFAEWDQIFAGSASVAGLIDRLLHKAVIITVNGDSWRLKESREYNGTGP